MAVHLFVGVQTIVSKMKLRACHFFKRVLLVLLGSWRSTTSLDFVKCLLRMLVRELTNVASKSTTLVTAIIAGTICRRCGYFSMFSSDNYGLFGEAFKGKQMKANCDCILKADSATDRKSVPSYGLLRWKTQESALQNQEKKTNKSQHLQG